MRQLTITQPKDGERGFDVRIGDRWQDGLTQDEALWVAAQFLMGHSHQYLKSAEEHAAFEAHMKSLRDGREEVLDVRFQPEEKGQPC